VGLRTLLDGQLLVQFLPYQFVAEREALPVVEPDQTDGARLCHGGTDVGRRQPRHRGDIGDGR
jgi:hypothetical protein